MADVKLSPAQTAQLLKKLEDGARNVLAARAEIIQAMAARQREAETVDRSSRKAKNSKKRGRS